MKNGGREAQVAAMENPIFADDDSAELMGWFDAEVSSRDRPPEPAVKLRRGSAQQESVQ